MTHKKSIRETTAPHGMRRATIWCECGAFASSDPFPIARYSTPFAAWEAARAAAIAALPCARDEADEAIE